MRIMVIEDQELSRRKIVQALKDLGETDVSTYENPKRALNALLELDSSFDVAFIDQQLPDMTGTELAQDMRQRGLDLIFVMITAYATVEYAVAAMRAGFYDFVNKADLELTLQPALERVKKLLKSRKEVAKLKDKLRQTISPIIGDSPEIKKVLTEIGIVARSDCNVLITGKSGTGKELVAQHIHLQSSRASMPFIIVNCAAIPENLIESQLFGHKKGAFTDAVTDKMGDFEVANGGTLFLDEIGEMRLDLQVKLLRAVEQKQITPVGESRSRDIDVRIISATNQPLDERIKEGKFREDLYYRLSVTTIHVPSLADRRPDIPALANYFLQKFAQEQHKQITGIDEEAMRVLKKSEWKGEVRELQNAIARAVIFCEGESILIEDLPDRSRTTVRNEQIPSERQKTPTSSNKGKLYRDGYDHVRNKLSAIQDFLSRGWTSEQIARYFYKGKNPRNSYADFFRSREILETWKNTPREDAQQLWNKVIDEIKLRRPKIQKLYSDPNVLGENAELFK